MTAALQKLTTDFIPEEDRLRLSGMLGDGQQVVLWLTQRLLRRMVPHLCGWLEKQPLPGTSVVRPQAMALDREEIHHMAQQAAQGVLQARPQAPVQALACAFSGLVQIVKLETGGARLQLILRVEQAPPAEYRLDFSAMMLRQWLNIVYRHCENALWPLDIWPQWVKSRGTAGHDLPTAAVLH